MRFITCQPIKHQMNWEKLDFAANTHERIMFLESWYTKSGNNSINICRDVPGAERIIV